MPSQSESLTTTDHEEIREWAERNGGKPASVKGTAKGKEAGVLRLDFPGGAGEESLLPISWDDWFGKFEKNNLAFLYQSQKVSGEPSTFFKLISRQ